MVRVSSVFGCHGRKSQETDQGKSRRTEDNIAAVDLLRSGVGCYDHLRHLRIDSVLFEAADNVGFSTVSRRSNLTTTGVTFLKLRCLIIPEHGSTG